jgi:hypothetical protein
MNESRLYILSVMLGMFVAGTCAAIFARWFLEKRKQSASGQ